uniref:Tubulin--tyrosine ligase-like protein 9 n=1 Tax=Bicosoecida sp. CB-2014 TaxID=1486930 RepID=A0A7S1C8K6_9STRA|mmetsp:Transcript_1545/g.4886  ORF Transcript_1545/g.4886 Transcript_1545/m.4886 type:complete len:492 (+) Transcript_1545:167-1642(+)
MRRRAARSRAGGSWPRPRTLVLGCLCAIVVVITASTLMMWRGLSSPSRGLRSESPAGSTDGAAFTLGRAPKEAPIKVAERDGQFSNALKTAAETTKGGSCPRERPAQHAGVRTFFHDPRHKTNFGLTAKILKERGWKQVKDVCEADVVFFNSAQRTPWTRLAPWQAANHLRYEPVIADKGKLAKFLENADRAGRIDSSPFWPRTFHQSVKEDLPYLREIFNGTNKDPGVWVIKTPGVHLGNGVFVVSEPEDFEHIRKTGKTLNNKCVFGCGRNIVQQYVSNPLLLPPHNRKFDLRVYWFVASQHPLRVYYHDGTTRSSLQTYDPTHFADKANFLTNVAQQKKSKSEYAEHKEELRLTFESLGEVLRPLYPDVDDPMHVVRAKICHALATVFLAAYDDLMIEAHVPTFTLMGADFLIDTNLDVWLLEVQDGPMRSMNTPATADLWTRLSNEQWDILFEIEGYRKRGEPVPRDLESVDEFILIMDEQGEVAPP